MVRKIYLLRHGEAEFPSAGVEDKQRNLTPKGIEQIFRIGDKFLSLGNQPELILCSTSNRTRQTLDHLLAVTGLRQKMDCRDDIYEASYTALLSIIERLPNGLKAVLIIGHNPGLSYLAQYLSGDRAIQLSTGELVVLEFDLEGWLHVSQGSGYIKNL